MSVFNQLAQSSTYYDQSAPSNDAAAIIALTFFGVFVFIAGIASYIIHALLLGRIFKKAGVDQWIAWVPFYNIWKTLELGGQQGFWAVLLIVPFVNIVSTIFLYIAMYNIGLKLQKEGWFVLLAIFFPIIWYAWLALDGSKWSEKGGAAPAKAPVKA